MNPTLRLLDFKVFNEKDWRINDGKDNAEFIIQMFGLDEKKVSHSVFVKGFEPFFYIKTNTELTSKECQDFKQSILENWSLEEETQLLRRGWEKKYEGSKFENSITDFDLVRQETLYGFDNHKEHQFIEVRFKNTVILNKLKNLFFESIEDKRSKWGKKYVLKPYKWRTHTFELYESKLPPLLRFFHIKNISPSGWIELPRKKLIKQKGKKKTFCHFEHHIEWDDIIPLPEKETAIPIKICSFDIEASSSHGDFPMPIKTYVKLAGEIVTYWNKNLKTIQGLSKKDKQGLLKQCILTAFGFKNMNDISKVYPKHQIDKSKLKEIIQEIIMLPINKLIPSVKYIYIRNKKNKTKKVFEKDSGGETVIDYLNDESEDNAKKVEILDHILTGKYKEKKKKIIEDDEEEDYIKKDLASRIREADDIKYNSRTIKSSKKDYNSKNIFTHRLPPLEGDKVTFIGSTFMYFGECDPYLNHGICLGDCNEFEIENSKCEIICCDEKEDIHDNERDVLLEWKRMLQQHQPDIIIGYNIFGFDWKFLCDRATELKCFEPDEYGDDGEWFCQISKNRKSQSKRAEKTIKIASGEHNLTYLDMDGIIQIDLYNYFRREVNLSSYKLQSVASHFIGDMVKKWEICRKTKTTKLYSGNLTGLQRENFVCFEMIGHSSDKYEDGAKFRVIDLDESTGIFTIEGVIIPDEDKKLRWGLGKDDISVSDLFQAFSESGTIEDRTKIARYCFQDCNLVHHLLRKNDILTGMSEIASICSVPIDFIVMRGQGIKLLSFIANKCADKNTLMPVLQKAEGDGGYEGAICFPPKCGLYIDNPVAVVDYSSLYPSCMISENISHDSKVWTKEYDLKDNKIKETGVTNKKGEYIYDNLEGFKYVDVTYDTYEWRRLSEKSKEVKIKVGYKICRFVQFNKNKNAIMPSILTELLGARKATRAKIKYKTITKKNGEEVIGIPSEKDSSYDMKEVYMEGGILKNKITSVNKDDIESITETYNSFMKNVFDKRQLGIKVTANSLYGQCGARTSAFYDKDIAASTTATGRKLLIYGKKVIEGVYGDAIVDTKFGKVHSKAVVVYGDTDSCFMTFNLEELDGKKIKGKKALEATIELAIEAGELSSKFLKAPHDLEYEKTFDPFLLLSKKRYVGMLYETNPNKCKRKSMGIVLKRRDNAPIVKDVYGGIIDILMNEQDVLKSIKFTKRCLQDIVEEKCPLDKLIISKSLRSFYKNPESIAHKVLADRIAERDPGNKPSSGARIPFVFIQTKKKEKLQGNRIETPEFIIKNKLRPDYSYYITNQIMKPVQQVYALLLDQIPEFKSKLKGLRRHERSLARQHKDIKKQKEKIDKIRNKEVKILIFDDALRDANNQKNRQKSITSFFG